MTTPTTYNVTVRLHDVAGTAVSPWRNVSATLCDSLMNEVDGFVADDESVVIDRVDAVTDASGVVVLALVANAEITPANTYYAVRAEGQVSPWLIEATASDDVHALLVADPDALAPGLLSAHLADTVAAHAASAVSFTPVGTVAATDVQAAIAEVASEKALLAHASQHAGAGSDPISSLGAVSFTGGISLTGTASVADRKLVMQGTEVVYLPSQASFLDCVYLGAAGSGASLAAGAVGVTGVGVGALAGNTTGAQNSAVGRYALAEVTTGSTNVALGYNAARGITTGSGNTVVGAGITGLAAASANLTAVGYQAAASMTTPGAYNTMVGTQAGQTATNLDSSALFGMLAGCGANPASATTLTGLGFAAGYQSTAVDGTFVGANAGQAYTGLASVVIGRSAGVSATVAGGVLVGYQAGASCTGNYSTGVGFGALNGSSGANVTAVGYNAGASGTYADCVLLGYSAGATGANQFVVGSASSQQTYWVPGHDTDTYLDWGTANTLKVYAGGQKGIEVNATGGAPYLGFFGAAAVAKPTGVAVSAAGIHAALVTLGLIAA